MKDRTTLTKSLHTITSCQNVARLLLGLQEYKHLKDSTPRQLATAALDVLGYKLNSYEGDDETVVRCIRACKYLLALPSNGK